MKGKHGRTRSNFEYRFSDTELNEAPEVLVPQRLAVRESRRVARKVLRVMELGCGNGSVTKLLAGRGYSMVGVDPSEEGVRLAREKLSASSD